MLTCTTLNELPINIVLPRVLITLNLTSTRISTFHIKTLKSFTTLVSTKFHFCGYLPPPPPRPFPFTFILSLFTKSKWQRTSKPMPQVWSLMLNMKTLHIKASTPWYVIFNNRQSGMWSVGQYKLKLNWVSNQLWAVSTFNVLLDFVWNYIQDSKFPM